VFIVLYSVVSSSLSQLLHIILYREHNVLDLLTNISRLTELCFLWARCSLILLKVLFKVLLN